MELNAAQRILLVVAVAAMFVAPIAVARFPPVLDLAQQTAQIPLFREAWRDPEGMYRIVWNAPNRISYPLLALGWVAGGEAWGTRLGLLACAAAVVAAIAFLARRLRRPPEHAALAAIFVFSGQFYGGFLNFLVGSVGFALWLSELGRESVDTPSREESLYSWLRLSAAALLLYVSHLLWMAAAGYVLLAIGARRRSWRSTWIGLVALAPLVLAGALWYLMAGARDARWSGRVLFKVGLWDRLTGVGLWSTAPLGGLRGFWEPTLLVLLLAWALFCLRPGNRDRALGDPWLARVALALAVLYFVLPTGVGDTVLLSRRFAPWSAVLALLALPPAGVAARWRTAVAAAIVLAHAAMTTAAWRSFEKEEMRGFAACLEALPDRARLLEIDLQRHSPRFWIEPFFQMAAYAQLGHRVTLGYSFASTPSSLVVFRAESDWPFPWTRGLEHQPEHLKPHDLDHFDFLLVHGDESVQARTVAVIKRITGIAGEAPWCLYAVRRSAAESRVPDDH